MKSSKIKNIFRALFILVSIGSLYFVPWIIVKAWILPLPNTIQEQVDAVTDYGFDGMLVYVDQGGKAPKTYATGWHNKAEKIPARPNALFKIASINKLYDAVAITKLIGAKKLDLNGTLASYFPELKDRIQYAGQITIQMLVQHRSGIPNFTDTPSYWEFPAESRQKALELILDKPAMFEPGTDYYYCNTNYLLLGMLIEKASGKEHAFDYIQEAILEPLNLKNTFASKEDVNWDDLMSGYYVGIEEDVKKGNYGSMIATAQDVGIFIRALNNGSLFQGDEKSIYEQLYEYEHGGLVPGYQSLAKYHPESDTVIVQFMNTTLFGGYEWNLMHVFHSRIAKIVAKKK